MRTLGNVVWLVLAGVWLAIGYVVAGLVAFLLILTIPLGVQSFKMAGYSLWPFGRAVVRDADASTPLSTVGNVVWLVLIGWQLALLHVLTAGLLALTVIGIPFAVANLKLALLALWPFGRVIVPLDDLRAREAVAVQPLGTDVGGPPLERATTGPRRFRA